MSTFIGIVSPLLVAALIAVNFFLAVRGGGRLRSLGVAALGLMHRRASSAWLYRMRASAPRPVENDPKRKKDRWSWTRSLVETNIGWCAIAASVVFVFLWLDGWVSPTQQGRFLKHIVYSWIGGILLAAAGFAVVRSFVYSWQAGRFGLFAARTGLSRIWLLGNNRPPIEFCARLREAVAAPGRIELLDFTGFDLIARGKNGEGGILASILSRWPDKEVRILLFNPCARDVDPDRKLSTVLQSQLSTVEMTREVFETKIRATLDKIQALNQNRTKPIEVRLYAEKPSFRVLVAGDLALLGTMDARDNAPAIPIYELGRGTKEASLHSAARSHFLRVWGDSVPVTVEAVTTVVSEGEQAPRETVAAR